jgi:hypothetical protein
LFPHVRNRSATKLRFEIDEKEKDSNNQSDGQNQNESDIANKKDLHDLPF